jgi:hypothetical protein
MGLKDVIFGDLRGLTRIGKAGAIEAEAKVVEENHGRRSPYDDPAPTHRNGNGRPHLGEPVVDQRGRATPPSSMMKQDPSIFTGIRFLALIMGNLVAILFLGFMVVSLDPGALQLIIFLPSFAAVFLFCALFAFVWITRKVSIPVFNAWRTGKFVRISFSGNDALFRTQEYGSGVIYSADGELKSYLKRGVDLYRCGGVDLCPTVDECGLTADPLYVAALGALYARGLKTYAEIRKAYKAGILADDTPIEIPDPVVVPFRLLKNYIMGAPTSSLLYAHTDYHAERKYRLRSGLFGEKKGMAMNIVMLCIGVAIIIFALNMAGIKVF